jgi:chromosomal replication initiation ATPase DnaA
VSPRQAALPLRRREALGRADFMVSASNAEATALVDRWPDWPDRRLALVGPEGSGKSHLAAIWAEEAGARVLDAGALSADEAASLARGPLVVEDVDRRLAGAEGERALFHLWTASVAAGTGLLLSGRGAPASWPVALPDLASRLASLTPARLGEPDEALLQAVLVKLFQDRAITPRPALLRYVLPRMERSFAAARDLVDRLDALALEEGLAVDLPVARRVLGDAG